MGGGRGLARPRDEADMAELADDSVDFPGGGDTILRGKSVGGVLRPERGLTRDVIGEKTEDSVWVLYTLDVGRRGEASGRTSGGVGGNGASNLATCRTVRGGSVSTFGRVGELGDADGVGSILFGGEGVART
jgi:hypothetical protein